MRLCQFIIHFPTSRCCIDTFAENTASLHPGPQRWRKQYVVNFLTVSACSKRANSTITSRSIELEFCKVRMIRHLLQRGAEQWLKLVAIWRVVQITQNDYVLYPLGQQPFIILCCKARLCFSLIP